MLVATLYDCDNAGGGSIGRAKIPVLTPRQLHSLRTRMGIRSIGAFNRSTWLLIDERQKKELENLLTEIMALPAPNPLTVPVYFDYQSQNSWLAVPVCETLSQKYSVDFSWRSFQQRPDWKPFDRPPAPKEAMAFRWDQSRAVGKILGLKLAKTRSPFRFNTRHLHMCTEYAKLLGKEMSFIKALLEAMHGRHVDIGDTLTTDRIAEEVGLNVAEMDEAIESGVFEAIIDQHRADAAHAGVFGVPTFVVDGQLVWGRQVADEVEEALRQAGVSNRN